MEHCSPEYEHINIVIFNILTCNIDLATWYEQIGRIIIFVWLNISCFVIAVVIYSPPLYVFEVYQTFYFSIITHINLGFPNIITNGNFFVRQMKTSVSNRLAL
jgi:hypothetical protein